MKELLRSRLFLGLALLLLLCVALLFLLGAPGEARGSVLARGPNGWLAARQYLAARGIRVSLLGAPLERFEGDGVLVSTFPGRTGCRPKRRKRSKTTCGAAGISSWPTPDSGETRASWSP